MLAFKLDHLLPPPTSCLFAVDFSTQTEELGLRRYHCRMLQKHVIMMMVRSMIMMIHNAAIHFVLRVTYSGGPGSNCVSGDQASVLMFVAVFTLPTQISA